MLIPKHFLKSLIPVGFTALALALIPLPVLAQAPSLSNVSVDFSVFSPDGDGEQDTVRYRFTLGGDSAIVRVDVQTGNEIMPTGALVVTLLDDTLDVGPDTLQWDGRSTGGILQPDGYYWFVAHASNAAGADTAIAVRVLLDTVAPQVSIIDVRNPYTPNITFADSFARVTVDLSDIGAGDQITLTFTGPLPGTQIVSAFFPAESNGISVLGWDGRNELDGMYGVSATVTDDAGHVSSAMGPDLNLDVEPPVGDIYSPTKSDTNGVIRQIAGEATDRNGFSLIVLTVASQGGTVVDSLCPCGQAVVPFVLDLPDSVAAGDTLQVDLLMIDLPGHIDTVSTTFFVDTLPPPPPVFDSLPGSVTDPILSYSGTATDADSVIVFHNGIQLSRLQVAGGAFSGDVVLGGGSNTLTAQSKDSFGNLSALSNPVSVTFEAMMGIVVPERFTSGDQVEINLDDPGNGATVYITDLRGKKIRTLEALGVSTRYVLPWDLRTDGGDQVGSGPCVFRIVVRMSDGSKLEERVIAVVTP